jgi:hypothetical protein
MLANSALQKDWAMYEQAKDVSTTWRAEGTHKEHDQ